MRTTLRDKGAAAMRRNLAIGFLLVNVLVGLWMAKTLAVSRTGYEAQAETTTQNMAVALDQSISGSANAIDLAVMSTQDFLEDGLRAHGKLRAAEVNAYLKRAQARLPELYGIRACDAQGKVVFGADVDPKAGASWSDRDFFVRLRDDPAAGLVVANPYFGKVTKKWVLSFVRRYNHPDGSFAGVISAAAPVEYFYGLLTTLDLGKSGNAVLRDSNLGLITRHPAITVPAGQLGAKSPSTELNAAMESGQQTVTFRTVNTSDGVERIGTYRRLSKVPFHVVAGLGAPDYLAAWHAERKNNVVQFALFMAFTALTTALLYRSYERLRDAQQCSAAVLQGASDGIYVIEPDGRLVFANDAFYRMLGREFNPAESLDVADWNVSLSRDQMKSILSESAQSGRQRLLQAVHCRKDGSRFHVEVSVLPQELEGRMVLFCSSRDVSARLRAEAEVRQTQELMMAAIDAAGEAFVMYDQEDRLVYCNDKYRELYAGNQDWIVEGTRFEDLVRWGTQHGIYKDVQGREEAFIAERLAAHQAGNVAVVTQLEDGRSIRVLDRKMPNGYTVGFRLDITGLVEATRRAEEAARSKAQFLANMSHEIRTPMNAILGLLSLLQTTDLTQRQRDYASKTEGAAQSLLGLLNDILDFSKAEAGKMALEREPLRLDMVLRKLSVVLSANVGDKDIEVLYDVDPALPEIVLGDAMRLQQVLINLCGNAIKFTSQGQVVLALRQLARAGDVATIEFEVRDTGIGIAPEFQDHIFSGFSQAEGSTTRRFGGTGLGLAISKRLVEMMGGHIQIHSTPGEGSTFSFVLDMPVQASVPQELSEPVRAALLPQRVLVVDDHPVAGKLTLHMVRSLGWSAELATSGDQALERVSAGLAEPQQGFPFPVIYMDWQLSGMDGWETTRRIRQLATKRGLAQPTVIMVTAHGRDMLAQRFEGEQDLLNGFLVKPVTASVLYGALMEAGAGNSGLRQKSQARSNTRPLSGMRILVVEDNLINQQVADELLSAAGASVSLAANGQLGVEAVAAAVPPFDVVLMDVQMPVLDGYGATRAIRNGLGLARLPIIAMTANAMPTDRDICLAAGMNEHIGKPFDMARLVSLLIRTTGFCPADTPAQGPAQSGSEDSALPDVEGLDLRAALGRMAGVRTLYVRTARDFARALDSSVAELQHSLARGDRQAAVMLLHTLKGIAGTLGATALAAQAAHWEALCKTSAVLQDQALHTGPFEALVRSTQARLHEAIARLVPAMATAAILASGVGPQASARQVLQHIMALAAADDFQVLQCFAEGREALSVLPDSLVDGLEAALQNLDLEAARQLCEDALPGVCV